MAKQLKRLNQEEVSLRCQNKILAREIIHCGYRGRDLLLGNVVVGADGSVGAAPPVAKRVKKTRLLLTKSSSNATATAVTASTNGSTAASSGAGGSTKTTSTTTTAAAVVAVAGTKKKENRLDGEGDGTSSFATDPSPHDGGAAAATATDEYGDVGGEVTSRISSLS